MGNKVIRLTEADIEKIVRNVLKEQQESQILPCPSGGVFKLEGSSLFWANNENDKFYKIWEIGAKPSFKLNKNSQVTPTGFVALQDKIFGFDNMSVLRGAGILPMNYKWSNEVPDVKVFYYSLDENGVIHGDVTTVIRVGKNTIKNLDSLSSVMGSDGDLPKEDKSGNIIFGDTYYKVNGKVNLIAVRSLGPRLRYGAPATTTTTRKPKPAIEKLEMSLTDMFVFDTIDFVNDARAIEQINKFVAQLKQYDNEFNTEQNSFKNHIIKSEPKVYGYASIDNDPTEKITGKFSPCKGKSTKSDYNKCLSQYRADKVTEIINDGLSGTGMDIFKSVGMGETDKFAPGMKWPEVKDTKKTAPNRRVYTYIPPFTYRVN